ncbi:MAG: hypothetical protein K2N74_00725, partial [Clostridiales bacterium]|nr:hypothetical protein [Clostridiales bacterium]
SGLFGRVCLSGEVVTLPPEKMKLVREGLEFYEQAKEIIRFGQITRVETNINYYRRPNGWQIYEKKHNGKRLVIVHCPQTEGCAEVRVPLEGYTVERAYTDLEYKEEKGELVIRCTSCSAGAFLLKDVGANR